MKPEPAINQLEKTSISVVSVFIEYSFVFGVDAVANIFRIASILDYVEESYSRL
jgi:hypothetical protein